MCPASYPYGEVELRGTPGLGRILALPVACLATAALVGAAAWTMLPPERWLRAAAVSVGILGVYELIRAHLVLHRMRRTADDWLRSATGGFVPPAYAWRAEQLTSPRERRMLAGTLRLIERSAYERGRGRYRPLHLPAVRENRESLELLADTLETVDEPVTPAGMLRVVDLVTDGAGPLWGATKDAPLGDAIATTLAVLTRGRDPRLSRLRTGAAR
jgi:hypothetical protein